jgi:hypothetical protein
VAGIIYVCPWKIIAFIMELIPEKLAFENGAKKSEV